MFSLFLFFFVLLIRILVKFNEVVIRVCWEFSLDLSFFNMSKYFRNLVVIFCMYGVVFFLFSFCIIDVNICKYFIWIFRDR